MIAGADSEDLADLLEVYQLCLLLGLKGRYSLGDPSQVAAIIGAVGEKIQRIRTEVDRRDGRAPLQIDYDIFERPDGWKVLDVAINGISLVVSYRAGFSSDIAKMGMDGLISQMSEHNAQHPTLGKQG